MVSDVLSLLIGLFAIRLAQRGRTLKQTFGWKRAEVIGALINGVFLMAVVLFIILEVRSLTVLDTLCSFVFATVSFSNHVS
jgi:Co/Zn/Cd efflux system component